MFNAPKLTNAGKALYYDNMAGTQIVFTTIQLGSGNISGPIAPMTALVTPVVTINAEAKSVSGQYAEISGHFSNAQLTDGFYFREIGVFAANPDYPNDRGKDILYCYQNAYDTADFIPVASVETVEKNITIPVIIGDAAAVSCTLSRSLILASMEDLDNHNKNKNAHEDIRQALTKKQEEITVNGLLKGDGKGGISAQKFDTKPTKDSGNLLTSGAVATAMDVAAALTSAAEYSAAATYAVGAYCTKGGKLYRCTVAIPQAEAWNAAHWTATTMGAELVAIYTTLANKANSTHAAKHAKGGTDPITLESIGAVGYDAVQSLTDEQKNKGRANIGAAKSSHNHDDRYYTEAEMNTKLAGKSDTSHNHEGRVIQPTSIELSPGASAGHGGYIDFHFNSDAADYTSRIYEHVKGVLKYNGHGIVSTANIVALLNVNIIFEKGFATYKNSAIKGSSVTFVQWRAGAVSTLTDSVLSTTPQNGSMIIIAKGLGSNPSVTLPVNILIINL